MEKSSPELDFDGWEVLATDGIFDFRYETGKENDSRMLESNYLIIQPQPPLYIMKPLAKNDVSQHMASDPEKEDHPDEEPMKESVEIELCDKIKDPSMDLRMEKDALSQVFFKKMKENEFVDMKVDSPKSSYRGIRTQNELGSLKFDGKNSKIDDLEKKQDQLTTEEDEGKNQKESQVKKNNFLEDGILKILKLKLNGMGAVCSIGVAAAATAFIFNFCSRHRFKQQMDKQKLPFNMIYTDEKRINEVVHQATRLNQVISGARVPLSTAHITFGGHYNSL